MGFFHHESDEARAHAEVSRLTNQSIHRLLFILKGRERWTQGKILARTHRCRCVLRGTSYTSLSYLKLKSTLFFYQAAKAYQEHVAKNGAPASHAQAKALLYVFLLNIFSSVVLMDWNRAGFSGAFIDHLVETKGVSNPPLIRSLSAL